jgi:gamma-glutamylcyclotransferase (GGCT)/AIG2-like uncharacterized protein YtfP
MAEQVRCLLFAYGTLRQGEIQHGLLAGARPVRVASTPPAFSLVEVAPYAALVRGIRKGRRRTVPAPLYSSVGVSQSTPVFVFS